MSSAAKVSAAAQNPQVLMARSDMRGIMWRSARKSNYPDRTIFWTNVSMFDLGENIFLATRTKALDRQP